MNSLEAARAAGAITASQEQEAENVVRQGPKQERSLFASLFNLGKQTDTDEENDEQQQAEAAPKDGRLKSAVAALTQPKPVIPERVVPLPASRPKQSPVQVAAAGAAMPQQEAPVVTTASTANNVFDARGMWQSPAVDAQLQAARSPFDAVSASIGVNDPTTSRILRMSWW